jgi:hypothetical protein
MSVVYITLRAGSRLLTGPEWTVNVKARRVAA